jgi:hypothetical protein
MAAIARMDQEKRTVEVNRLKLIETLEANRTKHVQDYEEAMAGYKAVLLSKIDEAFDDAKKQLETKYEKTKSRVAAFTDADIAKQRDSFTLIDDITVEMKVPRSYAKEYDAAIDMAKWDVRETLELTHAEFTCFVRDQWDWKSGFEAVSMLYKAAI